ncbi:MAG TPA: VCBS repeat-containing protein, partial [Candidatus Methylomirabilis sp.]
VPLTDRAALDVLRKELRLSAVALPKLTTLARGEQGLDLEVISTRSGTPVKVVSAEIAGAPPVVAKAPAREPAPAASPAPAQVPRGGGGMPAWIGPPSQGGVPHRQLIENPNFASRFTRSGAQQTYNIQTLPVGVVAIDFGDVNGDGQDDLVAITENEVLIFTRKGLFFALDSRFPGKKNDQFLTVGVADINGNGAAEIFVTNADVRETNMGVFTKLNSFALEQRQDKVVPIWENVPTYLRVLKTPVYPEGALLAQNIGVHEPFRGPVMRYRWDGSRYVHDPSFHLPGKPQAIFGFTVVDVNGDGSPDLVKLGSDNILRAFDEGGREIAEAKEALGIFPHLSLRFPLSRNDRLDHALAKRLKPQQQFKLSFIERPLITTPLGLEGRPGILVGRNVPGRGIGSILPQLDLIEGGNVIHVTWDGTNLRKQWETDFNKDAYVAGYGLFRVEGDLAMAVLSLDRSFFGTTEATLEIYRLASQTAGVGPEEKGAETRPTPVPR